ncbi:hypothetical protein VTH06DRAFT_4745 [Thermothelomyces fergusii]
MILEADASAANTRGQATTASQAHLPSPSTKSPSTLTRNNASASTVLAVRGRDKDGNTEDKDAAEAGTKAAAIEGTANGTTGSADAPLQGASLTEHTPGSNFRIDPLSQMAEGLTRASLEVSRTNTAPVGELAGNKSSKKGGSSFLSRLGMRPGKKKDLVDIDSDSELGSESRMDGVNAPVFSQTLGSPLVGGGYVPHHKEPPRYIRTRSSNKRTREFNRVFLAQELVGTRPPEDDEEAAAEAGKAPMDICQRGRHGVWAVLSTAEERGAHEQDEVVGGDAGDRLSAPVFREQPVMEFRGHTGEVLDLSWSKNNFLLSSSMDKTVRLWHMSRPECLCTFKHKDFVTRLVFHPRDDRFFLAGSLDTMLRLWSIPDKAVAFSAQLPDLVTAVAFSPDGKVAIAGLLNGHCMFFETEGLKLTSQIHVRSSRGKNARGSKITSIQTMTVPPPSPLDARGVREEVRVLITSNDSRVRVYNLRDKSLLVKLKGHENGCSQIAATFSDDGKHAQEDMVTTALFAPTKARMLLGQSGDPIYDLCNPPPVVLQSLEEAASAAASQVTLANDSQENRPHRLAGKRPEPSPAYIARSTHYDGHIIVTTGDTGIIRVFRQDCAYAKRRHESWETGSTFSRKLGAGGGYIGGGLGRSGSVLTRTSAGSTTAHSRRGSLSQAAPPSMLAPPQFHPIGAHPDRILSWRQGIEHGGDRRSALLADGSSTPAQSERSLSPAKASRTSLNSAYNLASEGREQPYAGTSTVRNRASSALTRSATRVFSSPPERRPSRSVRENGLAKQRRDSKPHEEPSSPPTPGFTLYPASAEEADRSPQPDSAAAGAGNTSFWNLRRWRTITAFKTGSPGQGVAKTRTKSSGSRPSLSISRQHADNLFDEREGGRVQTEGGGGGAGAGEGIAASRRQSVVGGGANGREAENRDTRD